MEEIKFRGVKLYPKEDEPLFVYGHFELDFWQHPRIVNEHGAIEVKPETVGQYAGKKDKNGKEIYDGDITRSKVNECVWLYEIKQVDGFGINLYEVTRYRNFAANSDTDFYTWGDYWVNEGRGEIPSWCEVIGNIHENPELLNELEKPSVGDV